MFVKYYGLGMFKTYLHSKYDLHKVKILLLLLAVESTFLP